MPGGRGDRPVLRRLGRGPRPARRAADDARRGRGPRAAAARAPGVRRRRALGAAAPRGRASSRCAVLTSVAVDASRGARSAKGNDALPLAEQGRLRGRTRGRQQREDLDPLSVDPYFERAAIEDAARQPGRGARRALERAVQARARQPRGLAAARRVLPERLSPSPAGRVPVLRAALYLDPFSQQSRSDYVVALRAAARSPAAAPPQGGRAARGARASRARAAAAARRPRRQRAPGSP